MRSVLLCALVGAAFSLACGEDVFRCEDCCDECPPPPPPREFKALTEREHVLNNFELSYNKRVVAQFDTLLDDNFTFYFSPGDVGGSIPEYWGRAEELVVTSRLFDRGLNDPNYPTCRAIRLDLKFESGVQWVDVPASGETWYTTTVYFEYVFEMNPDQTYIAVPGAQAQFTVRNAGTDNAPQWRLVEWRDLDATAIAMRSPGATVTTTWGAIKTLYR